MTNYETKQSNIAKQAANVTETEIKANEAKLANYRSYYDELAKLRKTYYDEAVKAAANMVKLDRDMAAGRETDPGTFSMRCGTRRTPPANETEEWNRKMDEARTGRSLCRDPPHRQTGGGLPEACSILFGDG